MVPLTTSSSSSSSSSKAPCMSPMAFRAPSEQQEEDSSFSSAAKRRRGLLLMTPTKKSSLFRDRRQVLSSSPSPRSERGRVVRRSDPCSSRHGSSNNSSRFETPRSRNFLNRFRILATIDTASSSSPKRLVSSRKPDNHSNSTATTLLADPAANPRRRGTKPLTKSSSPTTTTPPTPTPHAAVHPRGNDRRRLACFGTYMNPLNLRTKKKNHHHDESTLLQSVTVAEQSAADEMQDCLHSYATATTTTSSSSLRSLWTAKDNDTTLRASFSSLAGSSLDSSIWEESVVTIDDDDDDEDNDNNGMDSSTTTTITATHLGKKLLPHDEKNLFLSSRNVHHRREEYGNEPRFWKLRSASPTASLASTSSLTATTMSSSSSSISLWGEPSPTAGARKTLSLEESKIDTSLETFHTSHSNTTTAIREVATDGPKTLVLDAAPSFVSPLAEDLPETRQFFPEGVYNNEEESDEEEEVVEPWMKDHDARSSNNSHETYHQAVQQQREVDQVCSMSQWMADCLVELSDSSSPRNEGSEPDHETNQEDQHLVLEEKESSSSSSSSSNLGELDDMPEQSDVLHDHSEQFVFLVDQQQSQAAIHTILFEMLSRIFRQDWLSLGMWWMRPGNRLLRYRIQRAVVRIGVILLVLACVTIVLLLLPTSFPPARNDDEVVSAVNTIDSYTTPSADVATKMPSSLLAPLSGVCKNSDNTWLSMDECVALLSGI